MSDELSINARITASLISYCGIGFLCARGRDYSRKIMKITDKTKEYIQSIHDSAYLVGFNLMAAPPIYYVAGARTFKELAAGTAIAMGFGAFMGSPMGYAVDTFRDMVGLKECNRKAYPNLIKRQNKNVKRGLAALLAAGHVAIMTGIYSLTPETYEAHESNKPNQALEVKLEEKR
jgi:hypothetical protein